MPDLRYFEQNRYIEVTHTCHNNKIIQEYDNKFTQKSYKEQVAIEQECTEAWSRVRNMAYECVNNALTENGRKQFESDRTLLRNHIGYDSSNGS